MEVTSPTPQKYSFEFHGQPAEFFRIWIVNLLLTVVTLGIYSAWAKVRTKKYFYGNTLLDGSAFDYTASPMQILRGRIIAVLLLAAYSVVERFYPNAAGFALLGGFLLLPAIIVMALAFRMRNTLWRGIRFGFEKDFGRAYLLFLPPIIYIAFVVLLPFYLGFSPEEMATQGDAKPSKETLEQFYLYLGILVGGMAVAGLAFPWWQKTFYQYIGNRTRFGQSRFSFIANAMEFYTIYFAAAVVFIVTMVVVVLVTVPLGMLWKPLAVVGGFVAVFLPYAASAAYIQTQRTNIIFSNLELDEMHFISKLEVKRMLYFYITNTLAILLTLGLAVPWAMIRVARYRAECMTVFAQDFSRFIRSEVEDENAQGEEISDIFGLDIGL